MNLIDLNLEDRSRDRSAVQHTIKAYDVFKQQVLGQLVNIHEEGLMLIGPGTARENCIYQMELQFEELVAGKRRILLGAECLWTKETGGGGQHWAGFHIVDIAEQDLSVVYLLACTP